MNIYIYILQDYIGIMERKITILWGQYKLNMSIMEKKMETLESVGNPHYILGVPKVSPFEKLAYEPHMQCVGFICHFCPFDSPLSPKP